MIGSVHLLPLSLSGGEGSPAIALMDRLAAATAHALAVSCRVDPVPVFIDFAYDDLRRQAHSTAVLARLLELDARTDRVLLGVTETDIYVPILTFVFGEAQLNGPCALVSAHRLRDEFYGMPANEDVLLQRLLKETLHELGHTQGLRHCTDWRCVMSSAHTVERIDLRAPSYCRSCSRVFLAERTAAPPA